MDDIFLSYSRKDQAKVVELKRRIEDLGYSVWLDSEDIRGGYLWRTQIVEGIENCRLYIVVLTTNSINSDNVRREIDLARAKNKPILPIYAEPRPVVFSRELEYQLVGLQIVEYEALFDAQAGRMLDDLTQIPNTRLMPKVALPSAAVLQHDEGSAVPLRRDAQVVGRGPNADIDLTPWDRNQFVSQRHAELAFRNGSWQLVAYQEAKNATLVNGEDIPRGVQVTLQHGDRLMFADVSFNFSLCSDDHADV